MAFLCKEERGKTVEGNRLGPGQYNLRVESAKVGMGAPFNSTVQREFFRRDKRRTNPGPGNLS